MVLKILRSKKLEELMQYIELKFKIKNVINFIEESKKKFPYDYRYVILKEDNLNYKLIDYILKSYTDKELDLLFSNIELIEENNEIFNSKNTKKVLEKCNKEYNKRF